MWGEKGGKGKISGEWEMMGNLRGFGGEKMGWRDICMCQ